MSMKINCGGADTLVGLNEWIEAHPNIRIINIETCLINIGHGMGFKDFYRVWFENKEE